MGAPHISCPGACHVARLFMKFTDIQNSSNFSPRNQMTDNSIRNARAEREAKYAFEFPSYLPERRYRRKSWRPLLLTYFRAQAAERERGGAEAGWGGTTARGQEAEHKHSSNETSQK